MNQYYFTSGQTRIAHCRRKYFVAYALSVGVVEGFELYDVWVTNDAHDLQFTILVLLVLEQIHHFG